MMRRAAASRWLRDLALVCIGIQMLGHSALGQRKRPIKTEDFFSLKEVVDLQLSPTGDEVLYVLKQADLKEDRFVQAIWLVRTDGKGSPERLTDSEPYMSSSSPKGSIVRWCPDRQRIAFLSGRSGSPQIWFLTLSSGQLEQATNLDSGITSFEWSPDGKFLAFVARESLGRVPRSLPQNPVQGAVIEKENYSIYNLLHNQLMIQAGSQSNLWLVEVRSRKIERIADGHVSGFIWSPDSSAIAATKTTNDGGNPTSVDGSSVMICRLADHQWRIALRGERGLCSYSAEAWSPDGKQLAFTYRLPKERYSLIPRVGLYDFGDGKSSLITDQEAFEPFLPVFHWHRKDSLYIENTLQGTRGLFGLSCVSGQVNPIVNDTGRKAHFSFASEGRKVAFVGEDLQHPPEIYVSSFPFSKSDKLTSLNGYTENIQLPRTERIRWAAPDGVIVEGLLFLPIDYRENKKLPLLVLVHGGPTFPVEDRFEPYESLADLLAPYPLRMFAEHGFAVLIPNYRGTPSYGKAFLTPTDIAMDAEQDIMSGIEFMVKRGIADRDRLGLIGQSHGSWLGGVIVTRERIFKAASLFEGWSDLFSHYGQMTGWLDLSLIEYYCGGSPYENSNRYMELSPIFHTKGLDTAVLIESGELSLAPQGLEFMTALWRHGVPHESVVYPKTGHNILTPQLMLDSALRNLDWFDYWILGQDSDPAKRQEYKRWEKMKGEMDKIRMLKPQ